MENFENQLALGSVHLDKVGEEKAMLSEMALSHVHTPRNCGPLENATHYGQSGVPGEGPYVQMWLDVENDTISKAAYKCNGCPSMIASSSVTAQILTGRTTAQALLLEPKDLILILGGLPDGKESCAEKAVAALRNAIGSPTGL